MATPLTKPLTRQVQHDGRSYRVTLSISGVTIVEKGRRLGMNFAWAELIRTGAESGRDAPASAAEPTNQHNRLGMPDVVAADVLLLLVRVGETAKEASALIERASELPMVLAQQRVPPRLAEFEQGDWHVEPLLTTKQVGEILNVSTRAVRGLPLKSIDVGGQVRYRRAEVRRFMTSFEKDRTGRYR
jgi:hypothetical protein